MPYLVDRVRGRAAQLITYGIDMSIINWMGHRQTFSRNSAPSTATDFSTGSLRIIILQGFVAAIFIFLSLAMDGVALLPMIDWHDANH